MTQVETTEPGPLVPDTSDLPTKALLKALSEQAQIRALENINQYVLMALAEQIARMCYQVGRQDQAFRREDFCQELDKAYNRLNSIRQNFRQELQALTKEAPPTQDLDPDLDDDIPF